MKMDERIVMEDCKLSWRQEARERALRDLRAENLGPEEATERFEELYAEHYAELERLGLEGIE